MARERITVRKLRHPRYVNRWMVRVPRVKGGWVGGAYRTFAEAMNAAQRAAGARKGE